MVTLRLSILFLCFSFSTSAQLDSTVLFEKSKGTWAFPVREFSKIEKMDEENLNTLQSCLPIITTSFISGKNCSVRAVFDGYVLTVVIIEDAYLLVAQFGEYYIAYSGLTKPLVKKGDFITKGQIISNIQKDFDDEFRVSIYLNKNELQLNPFNWFVSNSCL